MAEPVVVAQEGFEAAWDPHARWLGVRFLGAVSASREDWSRTFERLTALVTHDDRPFRVLADCRGLDVDAGDAAGAIAAAYVHAQRHRLPSPVIAVVTQHRLIEHAARIYVQLTGYAGACFSRPEAAEAWLRAR